MREFALRPVGDFLPVLDLQSLAMLGTKLWAFLLMNRNIFLVLLTAINRDFEILHKTINNAMFISILCKTTFLNKYSIN